MVHDEIKQAIDSHIFDFMGYPIAIEYFDNEEFDHDTQTMRRNSRREQVIGVALPVSRSVADEHIQHGDSTVYIKGAFRQPRIGDWLHLPHVSQRIKSVAVIAHAGVVVAYQVIAGAG